MIKLYKDTGIPVGTFNYDIETPPLPFWLFSTGEQYVSHSQLQIPGDITSLMTFSWMIVGVDNNKIHCMNWIEHTQEEMIEKFIELADNAPLVIGKNNNKFDDKHMNTIRLVTGRPANPAWLKQSEDVQKHLKKHFNMQSYSLDHACEVLGLPCKKKMGFSDWTDLVKYKQAISWLPTVDWTGSQHANLWSHLTYNQDFEEIIEKGKKALKKFIDYNKFDVKITWELAKKISPYTDWAKFRVDAKTPKNIDKQPFACYKCGNNTFNKAGLRYNTTTVRQKWRCRKCHTERTV